MRAAGVRKSGNEEETDREQRNPARDPAEPAPDTAVRFLPGTDPEGHWHPLCQLLTQQGVRVRGGRV